jgi:hypothetical protein
MNRGIINYEFENYQGKSLLIIESFIIDNFQKASSVSTR